MGWEELSQSERPEKWNRQGKRLVWGGRQAATAFTGLLLEFPFWPPLTVVLAVVPFPAWHLGEKAWDPDRLSGLQGEVLQSPQGVGTLAPNCRQRQADPCYPLPPFQPSLHHPRDLSPRRPIINNCNLSCLTPDTSQKQGYIQQLTWCFLKDRGRAE